MDRAAENPRQRIGSSTSKPPNHQIRRRCGSAFPSFRVSVEVSVPIWGLVVAGLPSVVELPRRNSTIPPVLARVCTASPPLRGGLTLDAFEAGSTTPTPGSCRTSRHPETEDGAGQRLLAAPHTPCPPRTPPRRRGITFEGSGTRASAREQRAVWPSRPVGMPGAMSIAW